MKTLLKLLVIGLFCFMILIVLAGIYNSQNPQPQVKGQTTEIECFIDGKSVKATREVCAELSKKPAQAPAAQTRQPRVIQPIEPIQPPQMPKYEPPVTTKCRTMTNGDTRCYTTSF